MAYIPADQKEAATNSFPLSSHTLNPDDRYQSPHENAWIRFMTKLGWYPNGMPSKEKNLILKLDLSILIFGCLSFFTKYLDQQSITNAYVSGMKEDLHMFGNELNYVTVTFWASYCTFMIPACYFLTHYPANIVLPILEVGWGLSTFGLAWAQNFETLHAMRFLTGMWLFIVDAIITIPIALIGFFVFPDVPPRKLPRYLTEAEHMYASKRLAGLTAPPQLKISKSIFRRVLSNWHFYAFVIQWTLMDQNFAPYSQPFSLYLKAKSDLYSVVRINTLPTVATAISIVSALISGIVADKTGRFWIPTLAVTVPVLIGISLLVAWDVTEIGRLAAFMIIGFEGAVSPMTMGWGTVVMASDAEERAVVTASMNAIGQAIAAGCQVVQYPASGAPNFKGGFISALATTIGQLIMVFAIMYLSNRDKKKKAREVGPVQGALQDSDLKA
ncbi:putative major facilitator superfamily, MFS transporter superfamily [Septoria linicola]|nr:putative major facilitator superfamily, MFS transporter superfamily [Septoria linicola]